MRYRESSSLITNRSGMSFRGWFELALLIVMLVTLFAIEPISKAIVRDIIKQNATNQQLSYFSNEVVIQALLCRRFEKDILLHIDDQTTRVAYQSQWNQAIVDLERAILGFQVNATSPADQEQAARWQAARGDYQQEVLEVLQAIDDGTITRSAEANELLTSAKSSIRGLTETATAVAEAKDAAVESSSAAMSNTLTASARLITLVLLAGCVLWVTVTRRG
jgi:hypothetical protein